MGRKIKTQKNEKPNHIVFLCHIVSIKVDKQGLDISNHTNHVSTPLTPKLRLMKSSMKISGFGFQTWKFQNPPKSPFSNISNLFKLGSNLKDIQVIAHIVHTFSHKLHYMLTL